MIERNKRLPPPYRATGNEVKENLNLTLEDYESPKRVAQNEAQSMANRVKRMLEEAITGNK